MKTQTYHLNLRLSTTRNIPKSEVTRPITEYLLGIYIDLESKKRGKRLFLENKYVFRDRGK